MLYKDIISLSYNTVKSNRLRTGITIVIIALGIMALILIMTAIEAVNQSLTHSFSTMGANAFSIRYKERQMHFGGDRGDSKKVSRNSLRSRSSSEGRVISFDEARQFKSRYAFPAVVGIAIAGPGGIIANIDDKKTNPDVRIVGGDESYLALNGYEVEAGRNFVNADVESGAGVCILGNSVAAKLFGENLTRAIDKVITVADNKYRVIGVLKEKGSSAFMNADKVVITTYNNIRRVYGTEGKSYNIAVMVDDMKMMDVAIAEATGTFRPVRKLAVKEEDNFYIDKSDSIVETLMTNLRFLRYATIAIALITLMGAAIGLMNIMLVAVNERTKEIGLIKSLGGKAVDIRSQFLWESVLISLMGAVAGIIAGVLFGNVIAILLKTGFVVPWGWVIAGIAVCAVVGLLAGLYPAYKASRLDPIVALRYE